MKRRVRILFFLVVLMMLGGVSLVFIPQYFGSILYPLEYRSEIKKSAAEFNLNPNFVAGVIFTESRFNARATSRVGARGLMQIMPSTGAGIAKNLGDNDYSADKLYEPSRNIRYGTYYLKSLFDRYNRNEDYVLMHYNGGGGAVLSYQRFGRLPKETQGFVGKVKSARDMYNQIYGEWWQHEEFKKPETKTSTIPITNIREFWKVLLEAGEQ